MSGSVHEMDNKEQRTVIKFLTWEGAAAKAIHERLVEQLGGSAVSYETVTRWRREFAHGRQSIEDDPRSGRPSTSVSEEMCSKVEKIVMEDRSITQRQLAEILGISKGSVQSILQDNLGMKKVSTKWVPKFLTPEMRGNRRDCAIENLALMEGDEDGFFARIVTGDEVWIHHYDPKTPQEAKQWKHSTSPTPKRPRLSKTAGKLMMSIFWDCEGVLLIDFLERKKTINGDYYAGLIRDLRAAIKEKRRGKLASRVLLLHDNAPVHKCLVAAAAIREAGFAELNHPAYSPDLAPSDYYLFSNLKKDLRGTRFVDDQKLTETVKGWFEEKSLEFYCNGIKKLKERYKRVIASDGQYFE